MRERSEATSNEPVADNTTNEANENVARSNENLVGEEGEEPSNQSKLVRQSTNSKESESE